MDNGIDFLRAQVANAVMQHRSFVDALRDHESQAQDDRFRELCAQHLSNMREHQQMLERYAQEIGADEGLVKKALGSAMGVARDLADVARESDFLRLVGDIVMARQSEDTFRTFREAGRTLGIQRLAQIGEVAERHHDAYVHDANRLVQQMFVEHARGAESAIATRTSAHPGSRG